ncbi:MAG: hydroxymethylbilane synthase [bacterium]|nr:hydroxymethylbilane synthase [bacterium]
MKIKLGICKRRVSRNAAEKIKKQLLGHHQDLEVEIVSVETAIHFSPDDPEAAIRELEEALIVGDVDIVLHLLREIPVAMPEKIRLIGVTERTTPFDAFVSRRFALLDELPDGARVGYSHLRQKSQLLLYRPDFTPIEVHGSIDGRLERMEDHRLAALIVGAENLEHVERQDQANEIISGDIMLPAPGQGCLGFLARREDNELALLFEPLEDQTSRFETIAERAFLGHLGGNPEIAVGVRAALDSSLMIVEGFLATEDGSHYIRDAIQGLPEQAELLGANLARLLLTLGSEELETLILGSP